VTLLAETSSHLTLSPRRIPLDFVELSDANAGWTIALAANDREIREVNRGFQVNNARLPHARLRLLMLLDDIDVGYDGSTGLGENLSNLAPLTTVAPGENLHQIVPLDSC
jgi:hypothetical protein